MPYLRTYNVFISHAWSYHEDYNRVVRFLDETPRFEWTNLSVPKHDPLHNTDTLAAELRNQMRPAHAFLILAGMYVAHSGWIDFEIEFARRIGRPIIGIIPSGQARLPLAVQNAATEMVGWNGESIASAIRRHALADVA